MTLKMYFNEYNCTTSFKEKEKKEKKINKIISKIVKKIIKRYGIPPEHYSKTVTLPSHIISHWMLGDAITLDSGCCYPTDKNPRSLDIFQQKNVMTLVLHPILAF
jgi:hypothetical protein